MSWQAKRHYTPAEYLALERRVSRIYKGCSSTVFG